MDALDNGGGAVGGVEFLLDVAQMVAGRDFGDAEPGGDGAIGETLGDQLQNFQLAGAQLIEA
jgi:hypothetical protein